MFPIEKKTTITAANMLKLLAMLLAVVAVVFIATATPAQAFSMTGKVVAIDTGKKTLSVAAYYGPDYALSYKGGADKINTFALKRDGQVLKGSERMHFRDIRVGDWVTVSYQEKGNGLVLAGAISITPPPVAYASAASQTYSIPGRVVSIDRDAGRLTVDSSYYYGPSNGANAVHVFTMDRNIIVMSGAEPRSLTDISVGDWVLVTYRQENNGLIATDEIAITAPPAPYVRETSEMFSIPGKVVAINRASRTLTLDPSYCYEANPGGMTGLRMFTVAGGTVIMQGSEQRDFRDIRVGDWVTVNYHEERNGLVITDGVAFTSPAVIACPEKQG